jgi:hypothetical protein
MDAKIDTQSDQDGGKNYGKNIQVANGQGGETYSPAQRKQKAEHSQKGFDNSPVSNDEQQGYPC